MRLYILFLNAVAAKLQRIHKTHLRTKYKHTCIDFNRHVFEVVLLIFSEFYSLFFLNNIYRSLSNLFFILVELFKHLHFNRFKNKKFLNIHNVVEFKIQASNSSNLSSKNLFTIFFCIYVFFIFFSVFFDINNYIFSNNY